MTKGLLCTTLLLAAAWASNAAEVYRCEENGRISFRQTPCPANAKQRKEEVTGPKPLGWVVVKGPPESDRPAKRSPKTRTRSARKARAKRERRCFAKQQALERLEWQMRHGYKAAKSASLRQRRRAYEAWLSTYCK